MMLTFCFSSWNRKLWMSEKCPVFLLSYSPNLKNGFRRDPFLACVYGWRVTECILFHKLPFFKQCPTTHSLTGTCAYDYHALFAAMSQHRVELRTSSSSYVPGGVETIAPHSHAVTRYWFLDLDTSYRGDSEYVASAFLKIRLYLRFGWFRGWAHRWASMFCISITIYSISRYLYSGFVVEVLKISRKKRTPRKASMMHNVVDSLKAMLQTWIR